MQAMDRSLVRKTLSYRWLIFLIMAVAYAFVYFHRLSPAVMAVDLQTALETSGGFVGILASAYFYPYALMQFPAGLLSDSLGPRKTATCFLLVGAAGSALFGLASSVEVATAARVLVGFGVSMVFIPSLKLISQWFRVREFAFMTAMMTTIGGLGALVAAGPLALMTGWVGWRATFEIVAAGTFVVAALVWIVVRDRPQDMGWPSPRQIDRSMVENQELPVTVPLWEGARRVVTERHFWPMALWFFSSAGCFFGFAGLWAGPYLMDMYGLTREEAGGILNMTAAGLILGSPIISFLSDRVLYSRKKVLIIFAWILAAVIGLLNLYPSELPKFALYAAVFMFAVSSTSICVIAFTTTKELFPIEIAGTAVGTVNLFPFLGGAIFQPLMGWILDTYSVSASGCYSLDGYKAMLLFLLVASAATVVSTFLMKETFPSGRR